MARTKARQARANNLFQNDKDPWDIEHEAALAKFGPSATTEQLYPLAVHRGFEVNAYGKELIRRYPAFKENELHRQSLTKHLIERLGLPQDSDVTFTSEQLWKEHDRLKQEEADEEYEDESADDAAHATSGVGPSSDTVPTTELLGKDDDDGVSKTTEGPLPLPPGVEEEDLAIAVISKEAMSAFALAFGPPGYKLPSPSAPTEERSSDSEDDESTPPASPRPQGRNGRISLRAGSKRSTQVVDYRELDPSSSDDDESSDEDDLGQVVEPPKKKRKVQARKGKGRSQARRG